MRTSFYLFTLLLFTGTLPAQAQDPCVTDRSISPGAVATAYDSVLASRIPVVTLPEEYRKRTLPPVVDNSAYPWFPSIYSQYTYFSCQQYCAVTYTYTYELNRLRNVPANVAENRYPAHYTWNFMNFGGQYIGVNFLHTFHALMQQGQMNRWHYGSDTALGFLGWISGYEKYETAFPNRIKNLRAIPVNSEEGILTLKHYLNDHLDGSPTGGVACFTAAGPSNLYVIPDGTPEAGKHVVISWPSWATHGMTIVGYNDSVRYDINDDGLFTNHIDITGDGLVDVKDWEIGAFKLANSYGTWWADGGYSYVMYEAMGGHFEYGGVWNHCVYIVDPDTAYIPLLGMEFTVNHNQRNQIRITAGVNTDTTSNFPAHILEFPFFNYQGGPHVMQGNDTVDGQDEIELGVDVTPLLAYTTPGQPAKYFFILEENDPYHLASGMVRHVAFHNYSGQGGVFTSIETDVPILDQGTTYLSANGTVDFSPLAVTTQSLPSCTPGQPWSAQLNATGGVEPYKWRLAQNYMGSPADSGYIGVADLHLLEESDEIPYARVVLPFAFPFFGKNYDTVWMNSRGMVQFVSDHLPYPYLISPNDMLRNIPAIFPAFADYHRITYGTTDGMWVRMEAGKVTFRWTLSVLGFESTSENSFELAIFPDGSFDFHYGNCVNTESNDRIVSGYSNGDDCNYETKSCDNLTLLSGLSFRYTPPVSPVGIRLTEDGALTWDDPDPDQIFDIRVRVTDERLFTTEKDFQLSSGLLVTPLLSGPSGKAFFGDPLPVDLRVKNTGQFAFTELQMALHCTDPRVSVTDSVETFLNLGSGQEVTLAGAFNFFLTVPCTDGTVLFFTVEATAGTSHWNYTFPVTVSAPEIRMTSCILQDGANELLDPGEVADLVVEIGNFGSLAADSIVVSVSADDTLASILSPALMEFGQLLPNGAASVILRLQASRFIQPGSTTQLTLDLTAADGLVKQFVIDIQLGSKPVVIVSLTNYTSSVQAMKTALDSLGCAYDHYTWLGPHLLTYPALFLILGTTTGSHYLTDNEGTFFASYLRGGGSMYMETYADWAHNPTDVSPMFHIETQKVPVFTYLETKGVPSTFCEGLDFDYTGAAYYSIYELLPVDPAFSIETNTGTPPLALQVAYAGDEYKTIGSMVEFGHLSDRAWPSTKTVLMGKYLDFFGVVYKGPYPLFHAEATTVCRYHPVQLADDSYDNIVSWHWDLPGGEPSSSELQNPTVVYPVEGKYDVTLTVSDGNVSHTLTRKDFIRVEVCAGEEELYSLESVSVYPNPAQDRLNIIFPGGLSAQAVATLTDLTGKTMLRSVLSPLQNGNPVVINIGNIPGGMYILRIISNGDAITRKIIIRR